jgi:hypothetical protein
MSEIKLNVPVQLDPDQFKGLQSELKPYAKVYGEATASFDLTGTALIVAFTANALQIADILINWLKRTPHGNYAEIRLSDGRTFKMEANTDPDDFVKQIKAALKEI